MTWTISEFTVRWVREHWHYAATYRGFVNAVMAESAVLESQVPHDAEWWSSQELRAHVCTTLDIQPTDYLWSYDATSDTLKGMRR